MPDSDRFKKKPQVFSDKSDIGGNGYVRQSGLLTPSELDLLPTPNYQLLL